MKRFDPSLYLVTASRADFASTAHWLKYVGEAVQGGTTLVQYREKDLPPGERLRAVQHLKALLRPYAVPLVVNDSVELCREAGADGVHLGQSDGDPRRAREQLGPAAIIGLSLENRADLAKFLREGLGQVVDYVAVSPVFATTSKVNVGEPLGIEGLKFIKEQVTIPVVAIGGITLENVAEVVEAGADGVAVISALAHTDFPREVARAFKNHFQERQGRGWLLPCC